ncbi:MAG: hypothetical protein EAZ51_02615 [Sphingobacteriales bacterium]|nr:MAG: hypothetical protein EAZ64_03550 [Sphingobacteriales bacterium]TAF82440.1 MAG: hypothetical protein EAZ51_02615 [Sphingobacteriales bacterium]
MPKKILITAANNALAYQLAWHFKNHDIHFCDTQTHVNIVPAPSENAYAHQFLKYCLQHNIDWVFPLQLQEVVALAECEILFTEFGINLMITQPIMVDNVTSFIHSNTIIKASNFKEFSAAVLTLGYPNKSVYFGKADLSGQLYHINDALANPNILWNEEGILSFLQCSRLLQQANFVPLYIYRHKPKQVKALCVNANIFYDNKIDEILNLQFKKLQAQHNLKGFFKLMVLNGQLLSIKTLTVCV